MLAQPNSCAPYAAIGRRCETLTTCCKRLYDLMHTHDTYVTSTGSHSALLRYSPLTIGCDRLLFPTFSRFAAFFLLRRSDQCLSFGEVTPFLEPWTEPMQRHCSPLVWHHVTMTTFPACSSLSTSTSTTSRRYALTQIGLLLPVCFCTAGPRATGYRTRLASWP